MPRPHFSIVTPSYQHGKFIRRTIESVLRQRVYADVEYCVVDGNSQDDTVGLLRSFGDAIRWTSEVDEGQVDAINKGLRRCTGEYIGWINSDDTYGCDALKVVAEAFERNPSALWVHGHSQLIDEADRPIRQWVSAYKRYSCSRYSRERLLTENFIHQPSVFWRRSVMERIGLLDPRSELAFDYDWFLRLAAEGNPVYIPQVYASLRWYEQSKSGSFYARQLREAMDIARSHDNGSLLRDAIRQYRLGRIRVAYELMALGRRALRRVSQ